MIQAVQQGLKLVFDAIAAYIRNERNSEVGRANLIAVVILACLLPAVAIPPFAISVLRLLTKSPPPEWTFAIPVVAFAVVVVVAFTSVLLIPRKPLD